MTEFSQVQISKTEVRDTAAVWLTSNEMRLLAEGLNSMILPSANDRASAQRAKRQLEKTLVKLEAYMISEWV
tara:strand:- start:3424 stop:3639 length:216 start_codon:yes stop_codon:yes gene_type:complete